MIDRPLHLLVVTVGEAQAMYPGRPSLLDEREPDPVEHHPRRLVGEPQAGLLGERDLLLGRGRRRFLVGFLLAVFLVFGHALVHARRLPTRYAARTIRGG